MSVFTERGDALREKIFSLALTETGLSNMGRYGAFRGIFETVYKLLDEAYGKVDALAEQAEIDNATGVYLTLWGLLCGVSRKEAVKALGKITVIAYETGTVASGAWIAVDGSSLRLKATQDVHFVEGSFLLPVEAEFSGKAYNFAEGTELQFTRVISGIQSATTGVDWISTAGADEEDDDSLRARIKDRWKSLGEGNPPSKYAYIAASISGVSEAKVIRTPRGYGSTDVIIATAAGLPSEALLETVRSGLSSRGLVCRDLLVKAPAAVACPVSIEFAGTLSESAVKAALSTYALSLGIGGKLEVRKLYGEAISGLCFDSFEVLTPDRDVQAPAYGKIIPTVTATRLA